MRIILNSVVATNPTSHFRLNSVLSLHFLFVYELIKSYKYNILNFKSIAEYFLEHRTYVVHEYVKSSCDSVKNFFFLRLLKVENIHIY